MQFSAFALFLSSAAALGINCRGSGWCIDNTANLQSIHDQVGSIVASGSSRVYNSGEQIACMNGGTTSVCAFFQNGASGTANDAYGLLQRLLDHNCYLCGSVPTQDGNNVDTGELTVNAVSSPCCDGKPCSC